MDDPKKTQVSNLVLNDETVYEFNNSLASPDSVTNQILSAPTSTTAVNKVSSSQVIDNLPKLERSPLDSPASHVISEKVHNLAAQIYTELQKVIMNNKDDDVFSGIINFLSFFSSI